MFERGCPLDNTQPKLLFNTYLLLAKITLDSCDNDGYNIQRKEAGRPPIT